MESISTEFWFRRFPARTQWISTSIMLVVVLSSGCSNDIKKYEVSGKITFQGKPIEKGEVTFAPEGGLGRPDSSMIANGDYKLSVTDGKKVVRISAWSTDPALVGPPPRDMPAGGINPDREYIPTHYNEESILAADVKPADGQTFNFDLVK